MIIHVVQIQKKRYCQTWHPVEEKVKNYSRVSLINNRPKSGSGRETAMADKADAVSCGAPQSRSQSGYETDHGHGVKLLMLFPEFWVGATMM